MADAKFSFMERAKSYHPQWMAPEALNKSPKNINSKAADMWSFAVLLWELSTREVPFPDLSPMEAGMKVRIIFINYSLLESLICYKFIRWFHKFSVTTNLRLFLLKLSLFISSYVLLMWILSNIHFCITKSYLQNWCNYLMNSLLKFRFSKKATKFETISHMIWRFT